MFQKEAEWVEGPAVGGNQVKYESLERKAGAKRFLVGEEINETGWSPTT